MSEINSKPKLTTSNTGLRIKNIRKSLSKKPIVRDVSINVERGTAIGLLGQNGAGKTTTFYMTMGLINPDGGEIFLDDNNIIFTDKAGQIFKYNGSEKSEVLGGPEIYLNRQGGLMDIQLHPDFKDNNTLYITYAKKLDENGGNTTIARAKLNGNSLVPRRRHQIAHQGELKQFLMRSLRKPQFFAFRLGQLPRSDLLRGL